MTVELYNGLDLIGVFPVASEREVDSIISQSPIVVTSYLLVTRIDWETGLPVG